MPVIKIIAESNRTGGYSCTAVEMAQVLTLNGLQHGAPDQGIRAVDPLAVHA